MKITIELDVDKACWFDSVGGVDIPVQLKWWPYSANLQIACPKDYAEGIIKDLRQEAKNG